MKRLHVKRPFIATLVLLFAILGAGAYVVHERSSAASAQYFYANALKQANVIEDVSVDGVDYAVDAGVVRDMGGSVSTGDASQEALRLAYEKALARRSPLFSLAGNDPSAIQAAAASLQAAQKTLAAVQTDTSQASIVDTDLYPIDFLQDAATLESDRRQFLAIGDRQTAIQYERQLGLTISAYNSDLLRFEAGFSRSVPASIRPYWAAGLLVDRDQSIAAQETLASNLKRINSDYLTRLACIQGITDACDVSQLELVPLDMQTDQMLSTNELATANAVRTLLQTTYDQRPAVAPLIETDSSTCAAGSPIPPVFSVEHAPSLVETSTVLETPELVGDMRYEVSTDFPSVPFERFFAERGITYLPSAPELHYECPLLQTDFANVFAVEHVIAIAKATPASAYVSGKEKQDLVDLERRLSNPTLVLESDAKRYVNELLADAAEPGASQALGYEATDLMLMFKDSSAGFAQDLAWIAEIEKYNTEGATSNGVPVDLSAATLFYFRSGFLDTFMATNQSVINTDGTYFAASTASQTDQPYVYYSQLVARSPQLASVIIRDMTEYYDLHRATTTSASPAL